MASTPTRSALISALLLAAASPAAAQPAQKGVLGAGLVVGEPTGVSGKYYLGDDTAVDLAVGGALLVRGIHVHGDFLWHPWVLEQKESFAMPLYVGAGARILNHDGEGGEEDDVRFGLRAPAGILFDFTRVPLDVFAEIAGILDFRTEGDPLGVALNAGVGARYYF